MRCSLVKLCLVAAFSGFSSVSAHADVIFEDGFDETKNFKNWQVYQELSDGEWTVTEGAGVEVQNSVVVDAHSGDQYIELDSSITRGGISGAGGTNSAITRSLTNLSAGDYVLEYYYQPRTNIADDNTISVYVDSANEGLFSTLVDTANGVGADGWVQRSVAFSVAEENSSVNLSFRAEGVENSRGGFVDSVRLERVGSVPVPAGLWFILVGMLGLGALKWRTRVL